MKVKSGIYESYAGEKKIRIPLMNPFHLLMTAAALIVSPSTHAATILGGMTVIDISADLEGLGLTVTALSGPSVVSGSNILLPISGGSADPITFAGLVQHAGAGVRFRSGGSTVDFVNFEINTISQTVLADGFINGSLFLDNPIFTFDLTGFTRAEISDTVNPGIALLFSPTAAAMFEATFGLRALNGVQLGLVATAPRLAASAVPENSTWTMLIAGFGAIGIFLRKRRYALAMS